MMLGLLVSLALCQCGVVSDVVVVLVASVVS